MPNKLVLHTNQITSEQQEKINKILLSKVPNGIEVKQYNHHIEVPWYNINKYAECQTLNDIHAVNPNYLDDLTTDGHWVYSLPKLEQWSAVFGFSSQPSKYNHKIKQVILESEIRHISFSQGNSSWPNYSYGAFANCANLEKFSVKANNAERCTSMFNKCPKLYYYRGPLNKCRQAANIFSGCNLDKDSVLHVAETLCEFQPDTNNTINDFTLGIQSDIRTDEDIINAIGLIESKGWAVSVNGTKSSSDNTYSLRPQPIYAKLIKEMMPDGNENKSVIWGYYVTNPEEFKEFTSIDAAYEYFDVSLDNI